MLLAYGYGTVYKHWKVVEEKPTGFLRMYYVLGGDTIYESENESRKLKKGMLYCFPNKVPYKITHDPENRMKCLHLHTSIAPYVISELVEIDAAKHPVLKKMLEAFIVLWEEERPSLSDPLAQQMMVAVSEYLNRIKIWEVIDAKIEKSVVYILDHLDQPTSIEELSTYCGYHPQYFIRLFKECMGLPPHQYILSCRMKKAMLMLSEGVSVTEVAETLGYKESKNFSRTFKLVYGISPKNVKKDSSVII